MDMGVKEREESRTSAGFWFVTMRTVVPILSHWGKSLFGSRG